MLMQISWQTVLIVTAVMLALMIVLQFILSRRDNMLIGLVLPIAWLALACVVGLTRLLANGDAPFLEILGNIGILLLLNIPTALLLLIFFNGRKRVKNKKAAAQAAAQEQARLQAVGSDKPAL